MPKNKVSQNLHLSEDETDSADEVYDFRHKRKANTFFIDLTEGEPQSKKQKKNASYHFERYGSVGEGSQPNLIQHEEREAEAQIVKFIPGECSALAKTGEGNCVEIKGSSVALVSVIQMPPVKLVSPPCIVRVAGADYFKSADVIDLKQKSHMIADEENDNRPSTSVEETSSQVVAVTEPDSVNCQVVESPASPPQNQLMDDKACAIYDSAWFGEFS